MAAGASITNVAHLLKRVYSARDVENAVYQDNPLFALMPKSSGFTGSHLIHLVRHRDPQSRNPTFATAQTLANSAVGVSKGKQFLVTRVKDYSVYTLETESILATRDDRGAFLRTLTDQVDGSLNQAGRSMGQKLYGAGYGALASGITVTSLVFTVGEQVTNFEVGMKLVAAATESGALRNSGTSVATVTIVNRAAGTITVDGNGGGDPIATGDFLFMDGDRGTGASPALLNISGLEAWNPATAPALGSDSFFGVDRGEDPTRLAGHRLDVSALTPEEGLVTALHRLAREGGKPSHVFMSFLDSKNIHLALGSKAVTEYMKVGDIGFSSIRVTGPKGDVSIVPDVNAPPAIGRLLQIDSWELKHLADLFNFIDMDGARLSRVHNDDAFEGRINFYGNLICNAPNKNMRVVLPS